MNRLTLLETAFIEIAAAPGQTKEQQRKTLYVRDLVLLVTKGIAEAMETSSDAPMVGLDVGLVSGLSIMYGIDPDKAERDKAIDDLAKRLRAACDHMAVFSDPVLFRQFMLQQMAKGK